MRRWLPNQRSLSLGPCWSSFKRFCRHTRNDGLRMCFLIEPCSCIELSWCDASCKFAQHVHTFQKCLFPVRRLMSATCRVTRSSKKKKKAQQLRGVPSLANNQFFQATHARFVKGPVCSLQQVCWWECVVCKRKVFQTKNTIAASIMR